MKTENNIIPRSKNLLQAELLRRGYSIDTEQYPSRYIRYTSPSGGSWLTHTGMPTYPFVSHAAVVICKSKRLSNELAILHDIKIPKTLFLPSEEMELEQFLLDNRVVIVKPADCYGSHGLTMNISDLVHLKLAVQTAQKYSKTVMVQQQFDGEEVRFTIINGTVCSCILRQTPRVIGDGVSTIQQLIAVENKQRLVLNNPILPYPQLTPRLITEHFLTDQRVPAIGEIVRLSTSSLVRGGASLYDITDTIDTSYKGTALQLAAAINPAYLVVDLLLQDYHMPLSASNYVFLECNTAPSLRLYYGIRGPGGFDIASVLADMVDSTLNMQDTNEGPIT